MLPSISALLNRRGARDDDILYGTALGVSLIVLVVTTYILRWVSKTALDRAVMCHRNVCTFNIAIKRNNYLDVAPYIRGSTIAPALGQGSVGVPT